MTSRPEVGGRVGREPAPEAGERCAHRGDDDGVTSRLQRSAGREGGQTPGWAVPAPDWHTRRVRILVVDNYDSFTYNLVHLLEKLVAESSCGGATRSPPRRGRASTRMIVVSPGPGRPPAPAARWS